LERIRTLEQDEDQQALQTSRQREMEEWLDRHLLCFMEYDDTITRKLVEKIMVEDAETILVKIRNVDVVIEEKLD